MTKPNDNSQAAKPLGLPLNDQLGPLPEPYARVIAYTGRYPTGGYCAEVQADSVRNIQERLYTADQMRAYAAQAVAAEREACADEADYWIGFDKTASDACDDIARAIRGRGEQQGPNV